MPAASGPDRATRARTIVAAAESATLTCSASRHVLHDGVSCDPDGRPRLRGVGDLDATGGIPAVLEYADVAALPMRDRIRGRVTVVGTLRPSDDGLVLDPERLFVRSGSTIAFLSGADYAAARPDPLFPWEVDWLVHLAENRPDVVAALTRLLEPRALLAAVRITPCALDRLGLVLRIERLRTSCDVRLPFPEPVDDPYELADAFARLLAGSRSRR